MVIPFLDPTRKIQSMKEIINKLHTIKMKNSCSVKDNIKRIRKSQNRDFPHGTVVKNPPANAGDMGSIPGPGRSHIPWSN